MARLTLKAPFCYKLKDEEHYKKPFARGSRRQHKLARDWAMNNRSGPHTSVKPGANRVSGVIRALPISRLGKPEMNSALLEACAGYALSLKRFERETDSEFIERISQFSESSPVWVMRLAAAEYAGPHQYRIVRHPLLYFVMKTCWRKETVREPLITCLVVRRVNIDRELLERSACLQLAAGAELSLPAQHAWIHLLPILGDQIVERYRLHKRTLKRVARVTGHSPRIFQVGTMNTSNAEK